MESATELIKTVRSLRMNELSRENGICALPDRRMDTYVDRSAGFNISNDKHRTSVVYCALELGSYKKYVCSLDQCTRLDDADIVCKRITV